MNKIKHYGLIVYASRASDSADRLAATLGSRRWRDDLPSRYHRRRPYFRGTDSPLLVNWGSSRPASWLSDPRFRLRPQWLNPPRVVAKAIDKRAFFESFRDGDSIPVLDSTQSIDIARQWLRANFGVVVRKTTTGSGGSGIVVVQPGDELQRAPLYTRYYPKTHEFRLHMFKGRMIDFTQKKVRSDYDGEANRYVRSYDNGWIFAHNDLALSEPEIRRMEEASARCLARLGLDFGALDILAVVKQGYMKGFRICEVNTAPGLENTETIEAYVRAIQKEFTRSQTGSEQTRQDRSVHGRMARQQRFR